MSSIKETALQHCKNGIKRLLAIFAFFLDSVVSLKYLFRDTNKTFRDLDDILVLEIQGFGDALLSLASLNQIKERFPEKKITVLVQGDNAQFFRELPFVDYVIELGKSKSKLDVPKALKDLSFLLKNKFDLLLIPSWSLRHQLLSYLIRADSVIGYINDHSFRCRYHSNFKVESRGINSTSPVLYYKNEHILTRAAKPWKALGVDMVINNHIYDYNIKLDNAYKTRLLTSPDYKEMHAFLITVATGAVWKPRQWSIFKWKELINLIYDAYNANVVLIGGKEDAVINSHISSGSRAIDLTGQLDWNSTAGLLQESDLVISVDSGVMHLAALLKRNQIALFGPNIPRVCGPCSDKAIIIEKEFHCRPCNQDLCPEKSGNRCMDLIEVEDVFSAVRRVFERLTFDNHEQDDLLRLTGSKHINVG
jgi:ADP-heptose:LPS heptosyltransferase